MEAIPRAAKPRRPPEPTKTQLKTQKERAFPYLFVGFLVNPVSFGQIFGQVFDKIFGRGFHQGFGEGENYKYSLQYDPA